MFLSAGFISHLVVSILDKNQLNKAFKYFYVPYQRTPPRKLQLIKWHVFLMKMQYSTVSLVISKEAQADQVEM